MQMKSAGGFALLGPGIRVVEGVIGNDPFARLHFFQSEPPEIEKLGANPEGVSRAASFGSREISGEFVPAAIFPAGKACCRFVDSDNRDVGKFLCQMQRTFACAATGIQNDGSGARAVKRIYKILRLRKSLTCMVCDGPEVFCACVFLDDLG